MGLNPEEDSPGHVASCLLLPAPGTLEVTSARRHIPPGQEDPGVCWDCRVLPVTEPCPAPAGPALRLLLLAAQRKQPPPPASE